MDEAVTPDEQDAPAVVVDPNEDWVWMVHDETGGRARALRDGFVTTWEAKGWRLEDETAAPDPQPGVADGGIVQLTDDERAAQAAAANNPDGGGDNEANGFPSL